MINEKRSGTAVFINPLFDIIIPLNFLTIKHFIFIDCKPRYSSWETMIDYSSEKNYYNHYEYYQALLINKYQNAGYIFQDGEDGERWIFYNNSTNQRIDYYHSIYFNEDIPNKIQQVLIGCDTLIIKDYKPDDYILALLPRKFNLIVSSKCDYSNRFFEGNVIFENRVKKYYLLDEGKTENIYQKCDIYILNDKKELLEMIKKIEK